MSTGILKTNIKTPSQDEVLILVELVENCLHPITEELKRWQHIIGEHYLDHKLEEPRNSLINKPEGYTTIKY